MFVFGIILKESTIIIFTGTMSLPLRRNCCYNGGRFSLFDFIVTGCIFDLPGHLCQVAEEPDHILSIHTMRRDIKLDNSQIGMRQCVCGTSGEE